jgi:hypothetical protein
LDLMEVISQRINGIHCGEILRVLEEGIELQRNKEISDENYGDIEVENEEENAANSRM